VEILFALAVLAVGFIGFVTLFYGGISTVQESGTSSSAVAVAESMLELLRTQKTASIPPFGRVITADPTTCPEAAGSFLNNECVAWIARVGALPEGQGNVAVATAPSPATGLNFYTVTVTVSWTEVSMGRRTVSLVSGITD
jgi:Tfp pilus assembly protein PilV